MMVSLGVVLVVLGALGAWKYVGLAQSGTHPYLAVYKPVALGQKITADDLQIVSITSAAGLNPIPSDEADQVIGRYARVELVAGTLLTPQDLTDQQPPGAGQALVGLSLKANQRPSRALHAGDRIMVVELPDSLAPTTPTGGTPTIVQLPATVMDVNPAGSDGSLVLDVAVATTDFATIAALSNAGRIAVALVPGS